MKNVGLLEKKTKWHFIFNRHHIQLQTKNTKSKKCPSPLIYLIEYTLSKMSQNIT